MSSLNNKNPLYSSQLTNERVLGYEPEFIINSNKQNKKVLVTLEKELDSCFAFYISVAFITNSGITPLLQTLKNLEDKHIPGKILTTDYLLFSDPKALDKLSSFSNISLRLYRVNTQSIGFHTKGYIFQRDETYKIMIGSSNLTGDALTKNQEWNMLLYTNSDKTITNEIINEFDKLWNDESTIDYVDYEYNYKQQYDRAFQSRRAFNKEQEASNEKRAVNPNKMQVEFINNLEYMVNQGISKTLLISSTGTGKTYAAAFAARNLKPSKMLFLAHREQILNQAEKSFNRILGSENIRCGILSGTTKELDVDYLFSTVQMMSKYEVHENNFSKNEFDMIVIDEVHHAGAETYSRIMQYFKPKIWLGMTATPDTNNYDIYSLFDHNIVYEIRLQQAIENDLVCPFHYFGIKEIIEDEVNEKDLRDFNKLIADERVDYIIEKSLFYGFCGTRVKGLVFCSRKDEGKELSNKFNTRGYRTVCLTGDDTQETREKAIIRLTSDTYNSDNLDFIFTVDIFNEGVDIPEINQVIMLRPTQSPIVFIQQLGRGLRKLDDKEFVVILDFIGNYNNNFMIPIALSGDRSYNKDSLRKYMALTNYLMPGSTTIHFDDVSAKKIYNSINSFKTKKTMLIENYRILEYKLDKVPRMVEFYDYGEIDPQLFIDYSKSYHNFLSSFKNKYTNTFSSKEKEIVDFLSINLAQGKRPHELIIIDYLINYRSTNLNEISDRIVKEHKISNSQSLESAINLLQKKFNVKSSINYDHVELFEIDGYGNITSYLYDMCKNNAILYDQLKDLVELGLRKFRDIYYPDIDDYGLSLYKKYTRRDVCKILNWNKDESSTVYGYRIKYNTCPIFVTYKKKENISSSTKYRDVFVNKNKFIWETRNGVRIESKEAQAIINHKDTNLSIFLFIKKMDDEGDDFYYFGKIEPISYRELTIDNDKGKNLPIVEFEMDLTKPVKDELYDYLIKD